MSSFPHFRLQKLGRSRLILYGLALLLAFGIVQYRQHSIRSTKPHGHFSIKLQGFENIIHEDIIEDPPTISIDAHGEYLLQYERVDKLQFNETIYRISMIQAENDRCYLLKLSPDISLQSLADLLSRLNEVSDRVQNDWTKKFKHPGGRIVPIIHFPTIPAPPPANTSHPAA